MLIARWAMTLVSVLLVSALHAQTASSELDLGVASFKQARYEEAITHFKQSIALDPNRTVAHLYLAVAYAQECIPGADTPDNNQRSRLAIEEFERVLALHPNRDEQRSSLQGIASLYFNMKQFDRSKDYYRKVLALDPEDAETYYAVGVIDWTESYQRRMEQRAVLKMKPHDPLINIGECWNIKAKNEEVVKDGVEMLTKALSIRRDYDDAMAYMNLMYRERADIDCGDQHAYDADVREADKWVDLTIATKTAKANPAKANP